MSYCGTPGCGSVAGCFGLRGRIHSSVAGGAVLWRRLIEENGLGIDDLFKLVAVCATYILMRTSQGKCCSLLVIKQRRLPFHAVMTLGAPCDVGLCKLLPMNLFVTVFALRGRRPEVYIHQPGFEVRRFMTIDARRCTMRP